MRINFNETHRAAALAYINGKISNGVDTFLLESSSHVEMLCITSKDLATFVASADLNRLEKLFRVCNGGVELRRINFEGTRTTHIIALVKRGTLIPKPYSAGDWREGERIAAEVLGGIRTGDLRNHVADMEVNPLRGKTMKIEYKNCEGRFY